MTARPLVSYEPNPVLGWLYQRFFEHIEVDEGWANRVRQADARGTVVYVLRNLSFVDFFALDHLTKRLKLPRVLFANDLGLSILEPMGRGWWNALAPRSEEADLDDLRRAVASGASAALFLKRPPTLLEPSARGKSQGDPYIRALFEVQRTSKRPILLVPQVFVWSKQPDAAEHSVIDAVLGPREWPGKIRTVAQFLANYRHVTLRAGEPIDVKTFLAQQAQEEDHGSKGPTDDVLVRRITYTLLRRLERERRGVIGPTRKPPDRLREEVVRSPKLQKVITDMAGPGEAERRVMTWRALAMLREMEASLDMNTIAAIDAGFEQVISRIFSALEIDHEGIERLRAATKDGTVIFLPSHKSHIDYIVLAYVLYRNHIQLPVIAAGENLNFVPLGPILRRAGAFFIRRSFKGDRLYGAVVDAYMRRLVIDGWGLEFFLEGGRSRTGKLLPPKVGLLSLVVDAAIGVTARKIYFAPVSIGYERVVEEKSYVHELSGGEKQKEDVAGLLSSASVLRGRYGRVNVQFGELLTLEGVLREFEPNGSGSTLPNLTPARKRAVVTRLAYRVMNEINRVTAVTPGAMVATALLTHEQRGLGHEDLLRACHRLAKILRSFGARFAPSLVHPQDADRIRDGAIREACELFVRAGHVQVRLPGRTLTPHQATALFKEGTTVDDAIYIVSDESRLSLDLAKNIVVHFFVSRAMVATALLASPSGAPAGELVEATLRERVQSLSRLFKYEFQFRADATFDQIFDDTLVQMTKVGELERKGALIVVGAEDGNVNLYAQAVRNFVEGYRIAARALTALLKGPLTAKELTKRAIGTGERMFLAGDIERREAVSRPVIENAFSSFVDQGYLTRTDGKYSLPESYANATTVRTIEAKLSAFALPKST
ncbi:MAG: 1-acyl-sn-glycerol-3-phosphate acyltransferase [Polyangiaceae bacterium]